MKPMTVTISVEKKDGNTIVVNDKGKKWVFPYDEPFGAITFLVCSTMIHVFENNECTDDNFSMELTMTVK